MKILKTAIVTVIVMASGAAPAAAQDYYAGGQLGVTSGGGVLSFFGLDLVLDQGISASGFIGKDTGKVRIEGELTYRHNDIVSYFLVPDVGEMSSQALMGNLYYDFGDGAGVTPYIGAGLGIANISLDSAALSTSDSATAFASQFMLGIAFPLSDTMSLNVDLRSFWANPEFVDSSATAFQQGYGISSMALGLKTSF